MGSRTPVRLFLFAATTMAAAHPVVSLIALVVGAVPTALREVVLIPTAIGFAALLLAGGLRALAGERFHAAFCLGLLTAVVGCVAAAVTHRIPVLSSAVPHALDVLIECAATGLLVSLAWHEILLTEDAPTDDTPEEWR